MFRIALRTLWARKLRATLTGLAIVSGVMMVAGTYVLTDTIERSFSDIFTESNQGLDAVINAEEAIETDDGDLPPFSASVLDLVRQVPGVELAAGGIGDQQVAIIGSDGKRVGGMGAPSFAFSTGPDRFDPLSYPEGGPPSTDREVVVDKLTADSEGFKLGDTVQLQGKQGLESYTLVGVATLGSVDSFGGASLALLTLPEAQRITGKIGKFDQINVVAAKGISDQRLAANLNNALPKGLKAETSAENVASQEADIGEFLGFLKTALLIFAGVSLFVAAFQIFNTFSITVAQRTREFALLRTMGANRRQIIGSVSAEALAIGLVASIVGLLAGIAFAPALGALFTSVGIDLPNSGTVVSGRTVIVSLLLGTILAFVSALVPAVRATRVPPVAGLREGVVLETPRESRLRGLIALALTALGLLLMAGGLFGVLDPGEVWLGVGAVAVFIGVALLSPRLVEPIASLVGRPLERLRGISGKLARENAVRNPGRTASTAAALMIGLALVSFVAVFAAGLKGSIEKTIDQTILGDLYLASTDGFSDIPIEAASSVSRIDGIETVSPLRFTQYEKADGSGGYLTLLDPGTAGSVLSFDFTEGGKQELRSLGAREAIIDRKWGEGEGFGVGDSFTAKTASGEVIEYQAVAAIDDRTDFIGDYAASDVNAPAYGEDGNATQILVNLTTGADVTAVRDRIDTTLTRDFPTVESQNQQELKDSIADQLNQLLGVVYGLLLLAVIVSLFGIVNTLALSIHERTRELGLLRAVGMSRRQTRRIIRYEAVITALIGAVLGIALGVVFAILVSRPLADEGFTLVIPVVTLLVLMVLAMIAGVIAAIGPARRAARLDVLEALAYE